MHSFYHQYYSSCCDFWLGHDEISQFVRLIGQTNQARATDYILLCDLQHDFQHVQISDPPFKRAWILSDNDLTACIQFFSAVLHASAHMSVSLASLSYQQLTTQWLYWACWPLPFSCVCFSSSCGDVGNLTTESKRLSKAQTVWTNPLVSILFFTVSHLDWNLSFHE